MQGDAHAGTTVRHRSRREQTPEAPNLPGPPDQTRSCTRRAVGAGLLDRPATWARTSPRRGLDLLGLPAGTRLRLGAEAVLELTGLRNPCVQLDGLQPGLMQATLGRTPEGQPVRKAGVMAIVIRGGDVAPGDRIQIELPAEPHRPLKPV